MTREILIDPVTRIEGHSKISIQLDDNGEVTSARFHVTQVRGFEKFVEGRPFSEMPSLMARICGICPVSHLIASAKACDALLSVRIPPTAVKLRTILNLAQIAQSHALSFFYLSAPDFLLGMDSDPATRNIYGVLKAYPDLAREGVNLRATGQKIIEILGNKRIHPSWVVPGGVNAPLSEENRQKLLEMLPTAIESSKRALEWFGNTLDQFSQEIRFFANFETLYLGLLGEDDTLEHYDGRLRLADLHGVPVERNILPENYDKVLAEAVEPDSYLKSPYYKPKGYPAGIYRVGPLARLNIIKRIGTPLAESYFSQYRRLDRQSSFHYHFARLIEILHAFEKIQALLESDDITSPHVRAFAQPNAYRGVGISEAPRGMLLHDYEIDDNGMMKRANLIIATGQNNLAMNKGVYQVAKQYVKGASLQEGMLNRVEAVIRAYDPCLSCSTHAIGAMPLQVQLLAHDGSVLDEVQRG